MAGARSQPHRRTALYLRYAGGDCTGWAVRAHWRWSARVGRGLPRVRNGARLQDAGWLGDRRWSIPLYAQPALPWLLVRFGGYFVCHAALGRAGLNRSAHRVLLSP